MPGPFLASQMASWTTRGNGFRADLNGRLSVSYCYIVCTLLYVCLLNGMKTKDLRFSFLLRFAFLRLLTMVGIFFATFAVKSSCSARKSKTLTAKSAKEVPQSSLRKSNSIAGPHIMAGRYFAHARRPRDLATTFS